MVSITFFETSSWIQILFNLYIVTELFFYLIVVYLYHSKKYKRPDVKHQSISFLTIMANRILYLGYDLGVDYIENILFRYFHSSLENKNRTQIICLHQFFDLLSQLLSSNSYEELDEDSKVWLKQKIQQIFVLFPSLKKRICRCSEHLLLDEITIPTINKSDPRYIIPESRQMFDLYTIFQESLLESNSKKNQINIGSDDWNEVIPSDNTSELLDSTCILSIRSNQRLEIKEPRVIFPDTLGPLGWEENLTWSRSIYNNKYTPQDLNFQLFNIVLDNITYKDYQLPATCPYCVSYHTETPVIFNTHDINFIHRPIIFYFIASLVKIFYETLILKWLFSMKYRTQGNTNYFVKHGNSSKPIVFLHGVGIGLIQYHSFIRELLTRGKEASIILIKLPYISLDISSNMPTSYEFIKDFKEISCNEFGPEFYDKGSAISNICITEMEQLIESVKQRMQNQFFYENKTLPSESFTVDSSKISFHISIIITEFVEEYNDHLLCKKSINENSDEPCIRFAKLYEIDRKLKNEKITGLEVFLAQLINSKIMSISKDHTTMINILIKVHNILSKKIQTDLEYHCLKVITNYSIQSILFKSDKFNSLQLISVSNILSYTNLKNANSKIIKRCGGKKDILNQVSNKLNYYSFYLNNIIKYFKKYNFQYREKPPQKYDHRFKLNSKVEPMIIISQSFGSIVSSWISNYTTINCKFILIDPVSMYLLLPKTMISFFYKQYYIIFNWLCRHFIASEFFLSSTIRKEMIWQESTQFLECLPEESYIFLSERDHIVPTPEMLYLGKHISNLNVTIYNKDFKIVDEIKSIDKSNPHIVLFENLIHSESLYNLKATSIVLDSIF